MWRALLILAACSGEPATLATRAQVGRAIFLDPNMSEPAGQACGSEVACAWPAPEVAANVDMHVGHLGLSQREVEDLVAFLTTLTDEPSSR